MGEIWSTCCAKAAKCMRLCGCRWALRHVRQLSESLQTGLPVQNFQVGQIERMPFAKDFADIVLCTPFFTLCATQRQFRAMLDELWRVVKPGGMLFCRLGSRIGMDFELIRENIFRLPDGSDGFWSTRRCFWI